MNRVKRLLPLLVLILASSCVLLWVFWPNNLPSKELDRDNDGIIDRNDLCPDKAGTTKNNGCPEIMANEKDFDKDKIGNKSDPDDSDPCIPNNRCDLCDSDGDGWNYSMEIKNKTDPFLEDTDGDGIKDPLDKCPLKKGNIKDNGCPQIDSDGDGIMDPDDKCPSAKGPASNNGCPLDSDGDGVLDEDDYCINEQGPKANKGCPVKDTDGDGINDENDLCPNLGPATSNYSSFDKNGCPEVDLNLKKTLNKNELTWNLNGYNGQLSISLSYDDDNRRIIEKDVSNQSSIVISNLEKEVNGRMIKVTLSKSSDANNINFKNNSIKSNGFKCSRNN